MVIQSDLEAARQVEEKILGLLRRNGYDRAACFAVKLALEEGLNNAIRHGNGYDPTKQVHLEYKIDPERVDLAIEDEGSGFDPDAVPDPRADENLEKPCGRGIMLMRAYMDRVEYSPDGTRLHLVKRNTSCE
jgi:serine/threonine-protein kinase RsbW